MNKREKLLSKYVERERARSRMGSGDDMFYEQQIIDYVYKKEKFWIEFIKFIEKEFKQVDKECKHRWSEVKFVDKGEWCILYAQCKKCGIVKRDVFPSDVSESYVF